MRYACVLLVLALPAVAEARVLSLAGAKRTAERRLERDTPLFATSKRFAGYSVGSCARRASYIVDCTATLRFLEPTGTCRRVVRVRLSTPTSTRVRTSYRGAPRCTS